MLESSQSLLISQVLAAFSGLFGGLSISFFWQPKKLHQHGRFSAGIIIGCISVGATFALGFAAQNAMNLPYLLYGIEIDNNPLIFRAMKDIGIAMVASHYFWQVIRGRRKLGAPLTSMRSKKMRTDGHSTHKP